jgi:hypothetical protein
VQFALHVGQRRFRLQFDDLCFRASHGADICIRSLIPVLSQKKTPRTAAVGADEKFLDRCASLCGE